MNTDKTVYFNTKQTANLLGYSDDSYIRKLIAEGRIKAEKKGREWAVTEEEISNYRTKSEIASNFKALFVFNSELQIIADECLDERNEIGPKDALAAFTITKACKTHGAILLLAKEGYGEDACVLVRILFELLITLFYVLDDPTDERAYRYHAFDWVLRKKMFGEAEKIPELLRQIEQREHQPRKNDSSLNEISRMYDLVMTKYKYHGNNWSDKSIAEMAEIIGRGHQYKTIYKLLSQHAHSQPRVINDYASEFQNKVMYSMAISDNWVELNLVAAFDFFGSILEKVNDHFGKGENARLKKLVHDYIEKLKEINQEESS